MTTTYMTGIQSPDPIFINVQPPNKTMFEVLRPSVVMLTPTYEEMQSQAKMMKFRNTVLMVVVALLVAYIVYVQFIKKKRM